jgi:xylulokinase
MDPHVRGAFVGLGSGTTRPELTLAVIEGVAFAFREAVDLLRELGYSPEKALIAGGGARHALWRRAVSSVLGLEVCALGAVLGEESACGAAMLAAIGGGVVANMEEAVARWVRPGPPEEPLPHPATEQRYQAYQSLYPPLHQLSRRAGRAKEPIHADDPGPV